MLNFYLQLLLVAAIFCFGFREGKSSSNFTGECHQIEREALLEFKSNLTDPSNRLASWSHSNHNCCTWYGIFCDNVTGHVLKLNLSTLSYYDWPCDSNCSYKAYERILFGGDISPSLVKLKHLRYLDLSYNEFEGIPKFLGSMESLRYLDLLGSGSGRKIPHQLGNLSNLQHLSLGSVGLYAENLQWLSGLSSLKFLELNGVELGPHSNWLKEVNILPSLQELYLISCNFPNQTSSSLINSNFSSLFILDLSNNSLTQSSVLSWTFQLHSLTSLNLASNNFQGPIPIGFQNLTSLRELYLYSNNFQGPIPTGFQNLTSLRELDLSWNNFQGPIPIGFQNLTSLRELDLSFNNFSYSIPNWLYHLHQLEVFDLSYNNFLEGHILDGFGNMTSLRDLDLSSTRLHGRIPKSFKNLCNLRSLKLFKMKLRQEVNEVFEILHGCASKSLEDLDISQCQLSSHLSNDILGQFKSLELLDLSNNNMNGTLPLSLGGLPKLQSVDIGGNMMAGEVVESHFLNLTHLTDFEASGNKLVLRVASNWIPPFQQMTYLFLESWIIGPQFPLWFSSLKFLKLLDLSNCGISGTVPPWFWTFQTNLFYLNLSHNRIEGAFPNKTTTTKFLSSLYILDLNTNFLNGSIPSLSSTIVYLDISNNSFSGSLSNLLCFKMLGNAATNSLQYLNAKGNQLEGTIPDCWMNWRMLETIELSNNKFYSPIPQSFGTLRNLQILHLQNNKLIGGIPLSLRNCTQIHSLNLAGNLLTGSIAKWVGDALPNLAILILRRNKFQGQMPRELCRLASLRILDVANNNISGSIPKCINEFHAMTMSVNDEFYISFVYYALGKTSYAPIVTENALLVIRGQELEYDENLKYMKMIDLSNNNLSGEIPIEIMSLICLVSLNLSNNHLVGRIPQGIDELKQLESLDLSENHLSGNIPQSMATLTFLAYLNLSNNNLSGRIPLGTQLQSFNASSYSGNDGLCGAPLPNNCSKNGKANIENVDNGCDIDWFYVSMALGFVVGLWGVIGSLIFITEWRYKFFNFLDYLGSRIYWNF